MMVEGLGFRLLNLCEKHNYTMKQVSKMLGFSKNTFGQYVRGNSSPDLDTIIKISELFDVSLDYLLYGEEKSQDYLDKLQPIFERAGMKNPGILKIEKWQLLPHEAVEDIAEYFDHIFDRYEKKKSQTDSEV